MPSEVREGERRRRLELSNSLFPRQNHDQSDPSKSDTRKEPCGIYVIEKEMSDNKKTIVTLENCDQTVTVRKIVRE